MHVLLVFQDRLFNLILDRDYLTLILEKKLRLLRKALRCPCYPRMLVIRNGMKFQNNNLATSGLLHRIENAPRVSSIRVETRSQDWTIR